MKPFSSTVYFTSSSAVADVFTHTNDFSDSIRDATRSRTFASNTTSPLSQRTPDSWLAVKAFSKLFEVFV